MNAAFLPAARVASKVDAVLKRFYERAQGGETSAADYSIAKGCDPDIGCIAKQPLADRCVPIAIHWRGQARRRLNLLLFIPLALRSPNPS